MARHGAGHAQTNAEGWAMAFLVVLSFSATDSQWTHANYSVMTGANSVYPIRDEVYIACGLFSRSDSGGPSDGKVLRDLLKCLSWSALERFRVPAPARLKSAVRSQTKNERQGAGRHLPKALRPHSRGAGPGYTFPESMHPNLRFWFTPEVRTSCSGLAGLPLAPDNCFLLFTAHSQHYHAERSTGVGPRSRSPAGTGKSANRQLVDASSAP